MKGGPSPLGAKVACVLLALLVSAILPREAAAIDLYFEKSIHDPSTIQKDGGRYWTFGTGDGIVSRYSDDLVTWRIGDPVFPAGTWPSWIDGAVTNFAGSFWAPDVIFMEGRYYLYYSCFARVPDGDGFESAIGVAVSPSLDEPDWTDLGMVVSSKTEPRTQSQPVNTIDPGLFRDANGDVWMVYGSHYGGIFAVRIDSSNGKRADSARYPVAGQGGAWNEVEAAQVSYLDGAYYLFANLGECCAGDRSTYYVVVGRADSPTGPFLDRNGVDMWRGGGTTLLATDGTYIGPGHYGFYDNGGQHLVSVHYYDGRTADGWPAKLDLLEMSLTDGWPSLTRDFTIANAAPPTPVSANLVDGGRFTITSLASGRAVEVHAGAAGCTAAGVGNGTNVRLGAPDGGACQQWLARRVRDRAGNVDPYYWTFHPAANPAQAMDIYQFSQLDGGNVDTWSFFNNEAQQYRLVDGGDGYVRILARCSGKVLDVAGGSGGDGANVVQWRVADTASQAFVFASAGAPETTLYIAKIVVRTKAAGGGKRRGKAVVVVEDHVGRPVAGATVTGSFSGSLAETVSATTNGNGKAVLKTRGATSEAGALTFCVTGVLHPSLAYDPSQSAVTCGDL